MTKHNSPTVFLALGLLIFASAIIFNFTVLRPAHYLYYICGENDIDNDGYCVFCSNESITPQVLQEEDTCQDRIIYEKEELHIRFLLYRAVYSSMLFIGFLPLVRGFHLRRKKRIDGKWSSVDSLIQADRPSLGKEFKKNFTDKAMYGSIILAYIWFIGIIPNSYTILNIPLTFDILFIAMFLRLSFYKNSSIETVDDEVRQSLLNREKRRNLMVNNYRSAVLSIPMVKALQHFEFKRNDLFEEWIRKNSHSLAVRENMVYTTHHFE